MPIPIHFHIRWADTLQLDARAFDTAEAATAVVQQSVLSGEQCDVQQFDDSCSACHAPQKRFRRYRP
jgi:hypothetical protein